ncbi:MAG: hypothetical protein FJX68_16185 [Alphaproteobacteria bacterium]|nr:hypothetical protein [Alphaproteobacteria bacterium]
MSGVDDAKIERQFDYLQRFVASAWSDSLVEIEALGERIRVEVILAHTDHPTRAFYRAAAHYLEDVLEQRYESEGHERPSIRARLAGYFDFLSQSLREKGE